MHFILREGSLSIIPAPEGDAILNLSSLMLSTTMQRNLRERESAKCTGTSTEMGGEKSLLVSIKIHSHQGLL